MRNPVNINSSRRNIRGHNVAVICMFQLLHRLPTLTWLQSAMDFNHRDIRIAKSVSRSRRFFTGIGEDQADIRHESRQDLQKRFCVTAVLAGNKNMLNLRVHFRFLVNFNRLWCLHVFF